MHAGNELMHRHASAAQSFFLQGRWGVGPWGLGRHDAAG